MQAPPLTAYLDQFKVAAGEGALVELKLRLLADKVPALQEFAHAQRLDNIEAEVAKHFGSALSDSDKDMLASCRQLRNKILHCNFSAAREKLSALGSESLGGGVRKIDLDGLNTSEMLSKVESAIAGEVGASVLVMDSPATNPGNVFGWLLEVGGAGDFVAAANAFRGAAAIIDRLAVVSAVSSREDR
ncbi:MAG: hypothetical protein JWR16_3410 [Nevskia sp.]|nr:hypothetical protein [Nevskia sp.]